MCSQKVSKYKVDFGRIEVDPSIMLLNAGGELGPTSSCHGVENVT